MGICLITGDHPRHRYLANQLFRSGGVTGWVVESREEFVPNPPEGIDQPLSELFRHHFDERSRVEDEFFGSIGSNVDIPILRVGRDQLNSASTCQFISSARPKLVISYGCHKISDEFMGRVGCRFWNVHGGISPDYRGVTTHFWPSYFLEPQMTGMTLHETTNFIDAGSVILQTSSPLVRGDTLHRLAARNVQYFSKILADKLSYLDCRNIPFGVPQDGYGKVFKGSDWRPEHLRLVYEVYRDKIVDAVLDGKIKGRYPKLNGVL